MRPVIDCNLWHLTTVYFSDKIIFRILTFLGNRMFSLTYSSYEAKHIKTLCGTKRKTVSRASITITILFNLFKALPYKKTLTSENNQKKRKKKPNSVLKTLTNESTVQLISNQFVELFVWNDEHGWGLVSQWFIFWGQAVVTGETWWNIQLLFLYTQGETQISEGISLRPEAMCFPTHYQKDERKVNTVQKLWENSRPCLPTLWMIPKAPWPKTSHGFWLLFLLCLLLICVIWVSIKHYEIQSVQIDISKAIFILMGNIQPL